MANQGEGDALIKPEFLVFRSDNTGSTAEEPNDEPKEKKPRNEVTVGDGEAKVENNGNNEGNERDGDGNELSKRARKRDRKGQNKNRPAPQKFLNEEKLCPHLFDGPQETNCAFSPNCRFMHDVSAYLSTKQDILGECPVFLTYGKCTRGLSCIFYKSHTDSENKNIVNEELWTKMQSSYEVCHKILISKELQMQLRKRTYDFGNLETMCHKINSKKTYLNDEQKTCGALTDEDVIKVKPEEIPKIDWNDKLYLSPLTTVGNLPFRRICVDFGADITCSEMSLATSVLQGNHHEYALHRRHPCEKIWGVQLCAKNGYAAVKAAHVLSEAGIDYDFVDLNAGCPLDAIYAQGGGSGLMCRTNQFQSIVKCMTTYCGGKGKLFTVKMRTGVYKDKPVAHTLIPYCRDNGVSLVTVHGRSREQRYLKYANWDYIGECAKVGEPMPVYGNGDILSWEDYSEKKNTANCPGVMIGRGALFKPWIFQEIKEQRNIDLSGSERLELLRRYSNYGLDHWGSDSQGVATTRRFLLEWISFFHRYIPVGILERVPQRMNERPPRYRGRDDTETLLASPYVNDWVKISEMFLGPVPDNFVFVPKHKANAWG